MSHHFAMGSVFTTATTSSMSSPNVSLNTACRAGGCEVETVDPSFRLEFGHAGLLSVIRPTATAAVG